MSTRESLQQIQTLIGRRPTRADHNNIKELLCKDYAIIRPADAQMIMQLLEILFLDHVRSPEMAEAGYTIDQNSQLSQTWIRLISALMNSQSVEHLASLQVEYNQEDQQLRTVSFELRSDDPSSPSPVLNLFAVFAYPDEDVDQFISSVDVSIPPGLTGIATYDASGNVETELIYGDIRYCRVDLPHATAWIRCLPEERNRQIDSESGL